MAQPSAEFLKKAVFVVDSSSYIFRAYYAVRGDLKAPDGTPTHATFGFMQMVFALLDQYQPASLIFVWDTKGPGFRHELYPAYKANRGAPPEDLGVQIDNCKRLLSCLGHRQEELAGFEADDIIASLVEQNPSREMVVVTGDKDLLQLVGPRTWVLDTLKQKWHNLEEAQEKFGVAPDRISDVQAISGDSVDNVPGAPGIGPKGATELIQKYGSLDAVLKRVEELAQYPERTQPGEALKGKRLEALKGALPLVRTSRQLVSLRRDVPSLKPVDFEPPMLKVPELSDLLKFLGFQKWQNRFQELKREPQKKRFEARQVQSVDELKELLSRVPNGSTFAWDTETVGLDLRQPEPLVGFSFSWDGVLGYYVPLRHKTGVNLNPSRALACFVEFLKTRSDLKFVLQNAKFDWHMIKREVPGFEPPESDDTMVMSYCLDPSRAHGMDALAERFLDSWQTIRFEDVVAKGQNFSDVPLELATDYAAEDAVVTYQLADHIGGALKGDSLNSVYEQLDKPLVPILWGMEEHGICVDPKRLSALSKEFHSELSVLEKKALETLTASGLNLPTDFNLHSTKQVAQILFEELKLPILKKGKTGPSTDVGVLEELSHRHPFPGILLQIRELSKLLSTYVDALPEMIDPRTGRVHTDFSQTITATGRLASSHPNLQNIPIRTARGHLIREAFVAADGYHFVSCDFSQIELRMLAELSGEGALRRAFFDNADIHRRTAALILSKSESQVVDSERQMAKAINFGIVFGQTAFGLSKALGIPKADAQRFIDAYFESYPEIRGYMDTAISQARSTGGVRTITGRVRKLPDINSSNGMQRQFAERMAINTPVQGSAADLMKAAMLQAHRLLATQHPKSRILLQVHDELLIEVPKSEVEAVKNAVQQVMENQNLLSGLLAQPLHTPLRANVSSGASWGEL
jgi:DNA polymerase-1